MNFLEISTGSHVVQTGFKFTMQLKMALNM